jgi:hypothetical protein
MTMYQELSSFRNRLSCKLLARNCCEGENGRTRKTLLYSGLPRLKGIFLFILGSYYILIQLDVDLTRVAGIPGLTVKGRHHWEIRIHLPW